MFIVRIAKLIILLIIVKMITLHAKLLCQANPGQLLSELSAILPRLAWNYGIGMSWWFQGNI